MSFWDFFREQEPDEPVLFDTREPDPVAAHFEEARSVLLGLLPPAPLSPPASRLWREIESRLAADPELMLPVRDAMRERPNT